MNDELNEMEDKQEKSEKSIKSSFYIFSQLIIT